MRITDMLSRLALLVGVAIVVATGATAAGYHVEYAFVGGAAGAGPAASLLEYQQKLYGTTDLNPLFDSKVYAINPETGAETVVNTVPQAVRSNGLINFGGKLYGTISYGSGSYGAVYSLEPATGQLKIAYTFKGGADGCYPSGGLIKFGGLLYGMTEGCVDPLTNGTVYSFNPETGVETVVYVFQGHPADGAFPTGDLTVLGGALYGTTNNGGESGACYLGCGTAFKVDPLTGAETVLHSFAGDASDGALPNGSLIKVDGMLYGITSAGGSELCYDVNLGCGVIFSLDPATNVEKVLYSFKSGSDGQGPAGRMIKVGTSLYGVTEFAGAHNAGTVFAFDFKSGVKKTIHAFRGGSDGLNPEAGLTYYRDRLFGTTVAGGAANDGTVFSIRP